MWCLGTDRGRDHMALIKCPECGKEISDKAHFCPDCGYPLLDQIAQEKYSEERVERSEEYTETGYTGRKGLKCPICESTNIYVENDIPTYKKVSEIAMFGTVSPMTKKQYRENMSYKCNNCGAHWAENSATAQNTPINSASSTESKRIIVLPILAGIISICYALLIIITILSVDGGITGNIWQFLYALSCFSGGILAFISIGVHSAAKVTRILFILALLFSALLAVNGASVTICIITIAFIGIVELDIAKSK